MNNLSKIFLMTALVSAQTFFAGSTAFAGPLVGGGVNGLTFLIFCQQQNKMGDWSFFSVVAGEPQDIGINTVWNGSTPTETKIPCQRLERDGLVYECKEARVGEGQLAARIVNQGGGMQALIGTVGYNGELRVKETLSCQPAVNF